MRERREAFRDARLIVIATEGKDTERIYFTELAKEYTNPRVHVHILYRCEDEQNNSSPEHVLKQLNKYKGQYELESDDDAQMLIRHVEVAIVGAKLLDKNPSDRWPQTLGTRVYLLAESVMNRK